ECGARLAGPAAGHRHRRGRRDRRPVRGPCRRRLREPMSTAVSPADVAAAAQLACLLEISAPKPGNVSPGRHYADARYEHFLASAAAIGGPLAGAAERPIGSTIRLAIESTARWAPSNTNLGTVLLLAPVAAAALADCDR